MRAVMYHYVRHASPDLPHFRYLHVEDFSRQLDWLAAHHRMVGRAELFEAVSAQIAPKGVVLTFDDGFLEHAEIVLPMLIERGLWGMFFVPTGALESPCLLDVHRVHVVLGRLGGAQALELLGTLVDDSMLPDRDVAAFRTHTYRQQVNDDATLRFKRCLNYFVSYEHRTTLLGKLMQAAVGDEKAYAESFYLSPKHLRHLCSAGMEIGSHGHHHLVFSKLGPEAQGEELAKSFAALRGLVGRVRSFCYPYGGTHTYDDTTLKLLAEQGCEVAFDVDPREATDGDLAARPLALPRFDCNLLPHGQASYGATRPSQQPSATQGTAT